jgi:cobalt-zinc-cadmium efflux system outer membrane protein
MPRTPGRSNLSALTTWTVAALAGSAGCAGLNAPETDLRVREIVARTGPAPAAPAAPGEADDSPSGRAPTPDEVADRLLSGPRLTLEQLITAAMVSNPDLLAVSLDVRAAEGELLQARLYPNPVFAYEGEDFRSDGDKEIKWMIRQTFLLGGKYERGVDVGLRQRETAELRFQARKFALITAVKRAFWEVWGDRRRAVSVRELLEVARAAAKAVEQRVVAGTATRADLLRAQITVAATEVRLAQAESRLIGSWKALGVAVGRPELPPRELEPPARPTPAYTLESLMEKAAADNSEAAAARSEERKADAVLARARAEAVPDVTLGAGFSVNLEDGRGFGMFMGEIALPLWNRNQGGIRAAAARRDRAAADTQSVVNRLKGETAAAFAAFTSARAHLESYEKAPGGILAMAREAHDLTRAAYEQGRFSLIDVLAAQETYINAVLTHIDAQVDYHKALADIHGLLQFDEYEPGR